MAQPSRSSEAPAPRSPGFWTRLQRRLRFPRTLSITRTGRAYLVVTIGIGIGALNTGNNLLYLVLGMLLSTVVVSGVLSEQCLSGLEVKRLPCEGGHAGEPLSVRYAISSPRRTTFALSLSEDDDGLPGQAQLALLPQGTERIVRLAIVPPRRGPLTLRGVRVSTQYPLGLFEKSRVFEGEEVVTIYPRRGFACSTPALRQSAVVGFGQASRQRDGMGDLVDLVELPEGADVRRVHWRKSAAVGKLIRADRERDERHQYVVRVDPAQAGDELEQRCEEAAALTARLLSQGHAVGLEAGRNRLRPSAAMSQHRRILTALAWLGFEPPEPNASGATEPAESPGAARG